MIENLTRAQYGTVLRQDFATFAARCFYDLNPQAVLAMNWHLQVAAKLTAVREGKIRRLIINLPPRHLKSLMASIAFPAWCLGLDPSAQILCVSYAPGSRRQARPRLPRHHDEPVVSADLSDAPRPAPAGRTGVHHHPPGLPPRHLHRRRADRTRCRHHPDRRSLETGGGALPGAAPSHQRMVRPHPLQPAK